MKKAIYLCKTEEKLRVMYCKEVTDEIRALAELDDRVYTKEDVLSDPKRFGEVEIIFSTWGMPAFTEEEIALCFPKLEAVFYAAGTVQKFARPFLARSVKVFSAWAANAVPVAEYTTAQIILANKGFFSHTRLMAEQNIGEARRRKECYPGTYNERVGLIGCGMIGSLVAEMLKPYRLEVLVYDPFLSPEKAERLGVTQTDLQTLFSSCRVVSNHLANNEHTKNMLTYAHFASMMPYATFLNTGRGAQVVEADLAKALAERPDLTAVLDVTYPDEPPKPDHPFYALPNCFLTPHIAGSLGSEVIRMADYMKEEFLRYARGEETRFEVSMKMLETMA